MGMAIAMRKNHRRRQRDHGYVIVEIAFAIPALFLILLVLFWLVALGLSHSRAVDLAQQAARSLARGVDPGLVDNTIERVMPGAQLDVQFSGEKVKTTVRQQVSPPIPLLSGMSFTVEASSTALREPAGVPWAELPGEFTNDGYIE
ncbi:MAG: TadE family type IV pilus minor pilin [Actinomycetes bacterium]|jgi:hypothetical protein